MRLNVDLFYNVNFVLNTWFTIIIQNVINVTKETYFIFKILLIIKNLVLLTIEDINSILLNH